MCMCVLKCVFMRERLCVCVCVCLGVGVGVLESVCVCARERMWVRECFHFFFFNCEVFHFFFFHFRLSNVENTSPEVSRLRVSEFLLFKFWNKKFPFFWFLRFLLLTCLEKVFEILRSRKMKFIMQRPVWNLFRNCGTEKIFTVFEHFCFCHTI